MEKIDIVIPWVDGNDENWIKAKSKYKGEAENKDDREIRYRDWETLRYVFRGIEKYMPWINQIHFVTCGQIPPWLKANHPKLHLVSHKDYIPEEYLPTFSSHTIELNMHRIEGLAEQFIYFNDDTLVTGALKPEHFFRAGKPCDCMVESGITPRIGEFSSILCQTVGVINRNFEKKDLKGRFNLKYKGLLIRSLSMKPYHHIMGFYNHHLPQAFLKTTFQEVWDKETEELRRTCLNRFRGQNDVSQYLMRYWNLCKGNFYPQYPLGKYINIDEDLDKIEELLIRKKVRLLTINDAEGDYDFCQRREALHKLLEEKYPEKSTYENGI